MTHLSIYPNSPGWRRTDTSREAAKATEGKAKTLQAACLEALRKCGPMTADEIATYLGEIILSIRPRLSELKELHAVSTTGARRKNKSGHGADVLEAIE